MESTKSNDISIGSAAELSEDEETAEFIRNLTESLKSAAEPNTTEQTDAEKIDVLSSKSATEVNFGLKSKSKKKVNPHPMQNWWKESVTKYAFNLPTVRANLGRLVGSDVAELNDHQFMMNLRTSVLNDFDEKLTNRIAQRKVAEDERCKKLLLKCKFDSHNCPKKMLPLQSSVLAFHLQSEPINLGQPLSAGRLRHNDGPVFNINRKTNVTVDRRRKKLKSIRRTNFEHLLRQAFKDSLLCDYNESRAIQEKMKTIYDGIIEKKKSKRFAFIAKMVINMKSMLRSKSVSEKKLKSSN